MLAWILVCALACPAIVSQYLLLSCTMAEIASFYESCTAFVLIHNSCSMKLWLFTARLSTPTGIYS